MTLNNAQLNSGTTTTNTTLSPSKSMLSSLSTTNSSSLVSSPDAIKLHPATTATTTQFGPFSPIKPITSSLSTRDIVIQLRQLAQDPSQQIHLINNTECLKTLTDTLKSNANANTNNEIIIISLQTLQLLALNPNYRNTLRNIPNLLDKINILSISNIQRIQLISKQLKETINSKIPSNKYQQYQPRPLHKLSFTIVNLHNESDRDEIHTIGIKIKGIISITVNMQTHIVTFYSSRDNIKKTLIQSLKSKGFQVQTDDEKDDDAISVHSNVSNFTDHNKLAQLSSLSTNNTINKPTGNNDNKNKKNNSIIPNRYVSGPQYAQPTNNSTKGNYGITKYNKNKNVMSLAERLQIEKKIQQEEQKKQQQTQNFLTKVISYIW